MRRRHFLGLGASFVVPACAPGVRVATVAPQADPGAAPPTRRSPIDTVVIIIKENRTYDSLFGDFPGGDGAAVGAGACPSDDDDDEPVRPGDGRRPCHPARDVPRYQALARGFTLCDRFFSEIRGPSFPNHQMIVAGAYTRTDNPRDPVSAWRCPRHCFDLPTFPEAIASAGRTWRAYASTFVPAFNMFRALDGRPEIVSWQQLEADAGAGRLANASWVYPDWKESEHPPTSLCRGEDWTMTLMASLMRSPQWPRMAAFIFWDDGGGLYDHVAPPVIEADADGRAARYGPRVPCLVVSPWARRGHVAHGEKSFLSVLRFMMETLDVPLPLGRVREVNSMWDCFDLSQPLPPITLPERECPPEPPRRPRR